MSVRVDVLGKVRIEVNGTTLAARSYSRVFLYLALAGPVPLDRRTIARDLYPDLDDTVAANRFRVALSSLRKVFGDGLRVTETHVQLSAGAMASDQLDVLRALSAASDELEPEAEMEALSDLVPRLSLQIAPEWHDPWLDAARLAWRSAALDASSRLADLAEEANRPHLVIEACELAFAHDLAEESMWARFLVAKDVVGEKHQALARFGKVRKQLRREEEFEFSESLLTLAHNIRLGPKTVSRASHAEGQLYVELIENAITLDPESAMRVFGLRENYLVLSRSTKHFETTLGEILQSQVVHSEAWQKCQLALVSLMAGRGEREAIVAPAHEILGVAQDPWICATTLAYLGVASYSMGSIEEALRNIGDAIRIAQEAGLQDDHYRFHYNKGIFLLEVERIEEAEQCFAFSAGGFHDARHSAGWAALADAQSGLAWCAMARGEDAEALEWSRKAHDAALLSRHLHSIVYRGMLHSFLEFRLNARSESIDQLILCIRRLYRDRNDRSLQIACDMGLVCAYSQRGLSQECIILWAAVNEWRLQIENPRSYGLRLICSEPMGVIANQMPVGDRAKMSTAEIVRRMILLLRDLQVSLNSR